LNRKSEIKIQNKFKKQFKVVLKRTILGVSCLAGIILCVYIHPTSAYPRETYDSEAKSNNEKDPVKYLYDSYIAEGLKYLQDEDYSEAKIAFESARLLLPHEPASYINLGNLYMQKNDWENALESFDRVKNIVSDNAPKKSTIYYNLGFCSYQMSNYREAVRYFSEALKIDPTFKKATEGLKMCYGKIDGQRPAYPADENIPQPIAKEEKAQSLEHNTADKVLDILEENSQQKASLVANELIKDGSRAFKESKDDKKAVELLKESIILESRNSEAYYRLGVIYTQNEKFPNAIECFEKAININPSFTNAYINLGGVYGKTKKYDKALESLKKAMQLEGDNPKIYYNTAMVYMAMNKKAIAIKYFKKAKLLCHKTKDAELLEKINQFLPQKNKE
jgi:tetratricopeptide (TPR) repeat protein